MVIFAQTSVSSSLMTGTASAPSCPAGEFLRAKLPVMKSFCMSTTISALTGDRICRNLFKYEQ